jgi:ribosomal protein S18 acetylase RimI-like enzyme
VSGVAYQWRGDFSSDELDVLHAEGFDHRLLSHDWRSQVERHSLGWVTARDDAGSLVGFVNVPWDGDTHAFIIDTLVANDYRRQGIGKRMIEVCVDEARAARCEWLHVDFDDHLKAFYSEACGFVPTPAGTIAL